MIINDLITTVNDVIWGDCLIYVLVAMLLVSGVNHVWAQYPDPFFTDETRPNPIYYLYEPPVNSMTPEGEFYNDWWYYEWGKKYSGNVTAAQP